MYETMITVVGNVVDSPRKVRAGSGEVAKFRLASTPRRYDSSAERWVDGDTFYVDVECWDDLGMNVMASVSGGDPVVVLGSISTSEWESDTGRRSRDRIRARVVGHNMSRGISRLTKVPRSSAAPLGQPEEPEAAGPVDVDDEQYGDDVDPLTGELLAGRDYVPDPATLHRLTNGDLPEPAHA